MQPVRVTSSWQSATSSTIELEKNTSSISLVQQRAVELVKIDLECESWWSDVSSFRKSFYMQTLLQFDEMYVY